MTIEDLDKIDLISHGEKGVQLIIVDSGNLPPEQRLEKFKDKLAVYMHYINTPGYREAYPSWRNTSIKLSSAVIATNEMQAIKELPVPIDGEDPLITPVLYETVTPSLGRKQ